MSCPHCLSASTSKRKHRTSLGYRTYFCPGCGRRSNERTGSPFNDLQFPTDIVLLAVLWRLRYKLSFRDVAELLLQRGFEISHETIRAWEFRFAPWVSENLRTKRRGTAGVSWYLDETYIKVRGQWKYLYRAVDKDGNTVDFLLTAKRDTKAALRFLRQAIRNNCTPVKINIDKSGSNTAAIEAYNEECDQAIEIRPCKYLNNIIEQDHRYVKKKTRSALGFKAFYSAHATLQGIELIQMIRKGQVRPIPDGSFIEQFNYLAM